MAKSDADAASEPESTSEQEGENEVEEETSHDPTASKPPASSGQTPWYKKMHWQIALGIGVGLLYALVVRAMWSLPAIEPAGAGTGPQDIIAHGLSLAAQRAEVIAIWERAAAPFVFLGDLFIRALKMIIVPLIVARVIERKRSSISSSSSGPRGM